MEQISLFKPTEATDAPVDYYPGWLAKNLADKLFQYSLKLNWLHNDWKMYNQSGKLPRKEIIFGDERYVYTYSRGMVRLEAKPWPSNLKEVRDSISLSTGNDFPLVIGNLYEGGHHHIGWHDDGRPELGEMPAIASLSLGETRRFQLRKKNTGNAEIITYELSHGDLIVMRPGCQEGWSHRVPKTTKRVGVRINWTFRPWQQTN